MDWLFTREAVITLAVLGATASVIASILQTSGRISAVRAKQFNQTGYGFMAASMVLFIVIGFRS
jgi:hypothetical protein